jgi:uncharacterized protein YciI
MFIIELTYKVPLEQIDQHLPEHVLFLNKYYANGSFLASGRKVPRNGGIILAKADSKAMVETIISEDPFYQLQLAAYRIVEFSVTKNIESLKVLQD